MLNKKDYKNKKILFKIEIWRGRERGILQPHPRRKINLKDRLKEGFAIGTLKVYLGSSGLILCFYVFNRFYDNME
jgi:hypothetical protein